jgi:hypothetical protein
MSSPDPASLQNLNDIVLPEAVGWWPLAVGWYFLFGLLLIILTWFVYTSVRYRINNRYRRAALQQLQLLAEDIRHSDKRDTGLRQIPVLLKRTALSVYPRAQHASLTGRDWHDFLNSKVSKPSFPEPTADLLDRIAYSVGDLSKVDAQAADDLLRASHHWLKHHRPANHPQPGVET